MRLRPLLSAALILWMCAPALGQEWKEFAFQQDRFTCNFPGDPKITDTTFMSQFGHRLPARVYSVELSPNHKYSVTVVDYNNITQLGLEKQKACPAGSEACRGGSGAPGNSTGPGYSKADKAGAITYATWLFMQRDAKVTHLLWTNISLVEGHQIRLLNADKSLTAASVFMHEDKLYIAEGTVPGGYPEPGLFYQSLGFLDEKGNGIRYADFYHNGFPKPPLQGGGGGGAAGGGGQVGGRGQAGGGAAGGRGN